MAERGKLVKVGALWLRDGRKGKFMSGEITLTDGTTRLLVFKNKHHQEGDKKPDYEIFTDSAAEEEEQSRAMQSGQGRDDFQLSDDDVPF